MNFYFCRYWGRNFQLIAECLREQHFSISFCLINFRKSRKKIKFMKGFLINNRKYKVPNLFCRSGLSNINRSLQCGEGRFAISLQ